MQNSFKNVSFLNTVDSFDYESFLKQKPLAPFSSEIIAYLNDLSKLLNKDPRVRQYPDVATFAFFCRKANISKLKEKFSDIANIRLGRGVIFHVAPSNVPVNFAFSLVAGLLAGNSNVVRVPSKSFDQVSIIIDAINKISEHGMHGEIANRIVLVRYDRDSAVTGKISQDCDVRVIWGGDDTIGRIRQNPLPPRSFDITFADRYSICAIDADQFIDEANKESVVNGFYNDTFLFDQNACTSPHLVVWVGSEENVKASQSDFWESLHSLVKEKYQVQPVSAVDKITSFYSQAIKDKYVLLEESDDNLIYRVRLKNLSEDLDQSRCHSGYFAEYHADSLSELAKIINRKYQTLSYYGFSKQKLSKFINDKTPVAIDRIVPIGRTMDFSLDWDGYNLINTLSRVCEIA